MNDAPIPEDIDPPVAALVDALNGFPGLHTVGSCGGHEQPGPGQMPAGQWFVSFEAEHTEEGWRSLEFVAWAVRDIKRGGFTVLLEATAPPPYLNTPGACLAFVLQGAEDGESGIAASRVAELLNEWREDYIPVGEE